MAEPVNHDSGEQAAREWFYAQPATPDPWQPGTPDKLAEGLHKSAMAARKGKA